MFTMDLNLSCCLFISFVIYNELKMNNNSFPSQEALRRYWTDPSLEEGEKFLRDFVLNKGYKDQEFDEWVNKKCLQ